MEYPKNKAAAFSLIELIVVLTIAAILSAAAVASYIGLIRDAQLRSASEQLHFMMMKARAEAIKRQTTLTLVFQTGANWCFGVTTSSSCDCTITSIPLCDIGRVDYQTANTSNLSLSTTFATGTVSFDGVRGATSAAGSVTFTASSGETLTVDLNRLGFSRLCSSNLVGYDAC